jgi:hypothetical protein
MNFCTSVVLVARRTSHTSIAMPWQMTVNALTRARLTRPEDIWEQVGGSSYLERGHTVNVFKCDSIRERGSLRMLSDPERFRCEC